MGFNFGFFGTPEHRVFNYRPRYYDEEKEALKEKFGHVDGSMKKDTYGMVGLVLFFVVLIMVAKYFALL